MIALKVNNRDISKKELHEEWELVKKKISQNSSFPTLSDSLTFRYAKENIINRVILEEEAELMVDEVDFKLIQEEYEKLIAHYGGWQAMKDHFSQKGKEIFSYQLKANIEKSIKVSQLLEMWTKNTRLPNEAEMLTYFERNQKQFMSPQQILFSKFFLPQKPDPQNRLLMEGLSCYREKMKDYRDFLNKAQQIPNIDYQEKFYLVSGQIQKKVESVLLGIADDEISGIIQTEEGYYLFKRWSIIPPRKLEYDEVRNNIEKLLFEEKKQKHIREHLSNLRKQTVLEDFCPNLE